MSSYYTKSNDNIEIYISENIIDNPEIKQKDDILLDILKYRLNEFFHDKKNIYLFNLYKKIYEIKMLEYNKKYYNINLV